MKAALYVLTALVTGAYNFFLLMDMVNGAPINPLSCAALLGSTMLLGAGILLLFQPRLAAKVGLGGSLLLWVSYAPMITVRIFMPFTTWHEIRESISLRDYVPVAGILLGPILLTYCTVNSAFIFKHQKQPGKVTAH